MARRTTGKSVKRVDRQGAMGSMIMLSYDRGGKRVTKEPATRVDRQGAMGSMIMLSYDKAAKKGK